MTESQKEILLKYLNEEINQFFFFEFFKVSICDQEAHIVTLKLSTKFLLINIYFDGLFSEDFKDFSSDSKELVETISNEGIHFVVLLEVEADLIN